MGETHRWSIRATGHERIFDLAYKADYINPTLFHIYPEVHVVEVGDIPVSKPPFFVAGPSAKEIRWKATASRNEAVAKRRRIVASAFKSARKKRDIIAMRTFLQALKSKPPIDDAIVELAASYKDSPND